MELLFLCRESRCDPSVVWGDPFLEGVAALEVPPLLVFSGPSLLVLEVAAAPLDCVRDGDLSMAGEAGERELDDVEEGAVRFLGLFSLSDPTLAEVLLTPEPSTLPFLCLDSFGETLCCSVVVTALLSPDEIAFLCSACVMALTCTCSMSLFLPELLSRVVSADLPSDSLSSLGEVVKYVGDSWVSATSPILSSVWDEEWDSTEKREGELERSWSLAEWDQEGFVPFSLSASGLAIEDLEVNVGLCMPLTAGRIDSPACLKSFSTRSFSASLKAKKRKKKRRIFKTGFTIIFTSFTSKLSRL